MLKRFIYRNPDEMRMTSKPCNSDTTHFPSFISAIGMGIVLDAQCQQSDQWRGSSLVRCTHRVGKFQTGRLSLPKCMSVKTTPCFIHPTSSSMENYRLIIDHEYYLRTLPCITPHSINWEPIAGENQDKPKQALRSSRELQTPWFKV